MHVTFEKIESLLAHRNWLLVDLYKIEQISARSPAQGKGSTALHHDVVLNSYSANDYNYS